jgi:hypothetical protein
MSLLQKLKNINAKTPRCKEKLMEENKFIAANISKKKKHFDNLSGFAHGKERPLNIYLD